MKRHDNRTINAVLTDARTQVKMLLEMADANIGQGEDAKADRKMFRKLHKALALLQDCER